MNISNILTTARIFLSPFFILFLKLGVNKKYFNHFALLVFVLASITDFLDGYLARKQQKTTNLGKFLDPLADKILTTAAFLCFLELKLINIWVVFIVFVREFLVIFIRLIASKKGIVIAANFWGKLKTVLQIIAIFLTLIFLIKKSSFLNHCYNFSIYASTFATALSGLIYILKNKNLLKNN